MGGVQAGLFRLGTDAVIYGLAHPLGFRTGGPAARVHQVSEVWPCGPGVGVSKRNGFSMMDGRETVLPSADVAACVFFVVSVHFRMKDGRETVPPSGGRCVLGASGWKPLVLS